MSVRGGGVRGAGWRTRATRRLLRASAPFGCFKASRQGQRVRLSNNDRSPKLKLQEEKQITIGTKTYDSRAPLIIAELGTGHNADRIKGAELIDAAAEAGAGCVKFQLVYADEILHPNTGEVLLPGGRIRLFDRFKQLETPPDFLAEMKELVEKRGLLFLCTPFGIRSARELRDLKPSVVKIASPELNYTALLKEVASYRLPVLLSTGVSKLSDIEAALALFPPDFPHDGKICLLHCVTAYPAPETDYNLRVLPSLFAVFGVPTGVSDHSLDPSLIPCLTVAMGGVAVEKHFCLSRSDEGLDDPIALEPQAFSQMVRDVRAVSAMGSGAIDALMRERGGALVEKVLGDGVKRLASSEAANYERTNRSIHALRDIQAGEVITADMIAILRTEKILRPGLPPAFEPMIIGRKASEFIPAGQGITFQVF
ncbi:MAG: N-acetylneuraminate synthase family protein [Treponema sp.]|jgi:sialic acid synthase SpsE|nr:N-acetylneuraminate synthase family protein [Treponema sp.]